VPVAAYRGEAVAQQQPGSVGDLLIQVRQRLAEADLAVVVLGQLA